MAYPYQTLLDTRQHPEGAESLTSQTETPEIELVSLETDEQFQDLSESEGCKLPISETETSDIEVVPFETDEDFQIIRTLATPDSQTSATIR
jgi:hypothetical protein